MSKQTAVEWLFQQIYGDTGHIGSYTTDGKDAFEAFEKAKALEQWQIEQAYDKGNSDAFHGKHKKENYYNETYKGGEQ